MAKSHKELGNVEIQILGSLYDEPDQFIRSVKKGLGKDYKTVWEAVTRLVTKGYVESVKTEVTKRGNTEKVYRLSDKGLAYVLAYGIRNVKNVKEPYEMVQFIKPIKVIMNSVSPKVADRLVHKGFKLYLSILEENEKVTPEEILEYMAAALGSWTILHLDDLNKVEPTIDFRKKPSREEVVSNMKILVSALEPVKKEGERKELEEEDK